MTERYNALIVELERDIREDDAEYLINAIRMLRGVMNVRGHTADFDFDLAQSRAKYELRSKIFELLKL